MGQNENWCGTYLICYCSKPSNKVLLGFLITGNVLMLDHLLHSLLLIGKLFRLFFLQGLHNLESN